MSKITAFYIKSAFGFAIGCCIFVAMTLMLDTTNPFVALVCTIVFGLFFPTVQQFFAKLDQLKEQEKREKSGC